MGKALTYGRRYALSPLLALLRKTISTYLAAPNNGRPRPERHPGNGGPTTGTAASTAVTRPNGQGQQVTPANPARQPSTPNRRQVRDKLIAEMTKLATADDAALWVQRQLPEKNNLTAADAGQVELAFQLKLTVLSSQESDNGPAAQSTANARRRQNAAHVRPRNSRRDGVASRQAKPKPIDKTVLVFPEPRRLRDRDHVKFVANHPCLVCGRKPADAHHLRFAQSRALGRKVSDEFTVPLCRGHHREVHGCGDEASWWSKSEINPLETAERSGCRLILYRRNTSKQNQSHRTRVHDYAAIERGRLRYPAAGANRNFRRY